MRRMLEALAPMPAVSVAIAAMWLALAPAVDAKNALLAAALALIIPWLTQRFWPDYPRLHRPLLATRLFARVVLDIVLANWQVARLVLGPQPKLRPAFVVMPVDIEDPFVATLLASIISLTPGTVLIEFDRAARNFHIHFLDITSPDAALRQIKRRYEAPLKEIFRC
jgi:multicomponent K+:H+ antiporter subunit E